MHLNYWQRQRLDVLITCDACKFTQLAKNQYFILKCNGGKIGSFKKIKVVAFAITISSAVESSVLLPDLQIPFPKFGTRKSFYTKPIGKRPSPPKPNIQQNIRLWKFRAACKSASHIYHHISHLPHIPQVHKYHVKQMHHRSQTPYIIFYWWITHMWITCNHNRTIASISPLAQHYHYHLPLLPCTQQPPWRERQDPPYQWHPQVQPPLGP